MGIDSLLRLGILEGELGARRQTFGKNDHGAGGADRLRVPVDGLISAGKMDENRHAQKHTLSAAPLLIRLRANGRGAALDLHAGRGLRCVRFLRRCQSSNPQNSISGAMSSTPYSQPSGC